jgi:glycine cleavage system H lipoate-binding protein
MVAFGIFFLILLFITIDYLVHKKELEKEAKGPLSKKLRRTLKKDLIIDHMPCGLFFTPGHLWVELCRNGELKIGVTELPLFAMGSNSCIEVRSEKKDLQESDSFITLHNNDLSIEFRAPFNFEVVEFNDVEDRLVFLDPYRDGWLARVKVDNLPKVIRSLHLCAEARDWMGQEIDSLQAFLNASPEEHTSKEEVSNLYDGFFCHLKNDYFKTVSRWITDPATR